MSTSSPKPNNEEIMAPPEPNDEKKDFPPRRISKSEIAEKEPKDKLYPNSILGECLLGEDEDFFERDP